MIALKHALLLLVLTMDVSNLRSCRSSRNNGLGRRSNGNVELNAREGKVGRRRDSESRVAEKASTAGGMHRLCIAIELPCKNLKGVIGRRLKRRSKRSKDRSRKVGGNGGNSSHGELLTGKNIITIVQHNATINK
jgi:hypothetical protein